MRILNIWTFNDGYRVVFFNQQKFEHIVIEPGYGFKLGEECFPHDKVSYRNIWKKYETWRRQVETVERKRRMA